ncbi:hypothetical protein JHK87_016100 [Glycine soja]|nr:hypothetical protein JHK87_016100 [Glycine soja]
MTPSEAIGIWKESLDNAAAIAILGPHHDQWRSLRKSAGEDKIIKALVSHSSIGFTLIELKEKGALDAEEQIGKAHVT